MLRYQASGFLFYGHIPLSMVMGDIGRSIFLSNDLSWILTSLYIYSHLNSKIYLYFASKQIEMLKLTILLFIRKTDSFENYKKLVCLVSISIYLRLDNDYLKMTLVETQSRERLKREYDFQKNLVFTKQSQFDSSRFF